ncbi:hypothetical protein QL285_091583 [Trifolium repens]|nr:hypothetical protein QL285_091583 [Trifolium repens]
MATGNISQRRDDDDGYLFHDVDDNPMDTVIAPNVQHVTGAAIITVVHKTDPRDRRQATPSSDDESVENVHRTPARAAEKATASGEKAPATNKLPKRPPQILMPMTTEEGFRTLIAAMNE